MFRSGIGYALALALLGGAWVYGQGSGPAGDSLESRVGKVITVTEVGRSPEKCLIVQVWRLPDGSPAMQARTVATGELMTIVESSKPDPSGARFRVYRWGPQGVPPAGTPVPPGFAKAAPSSSRLGDKPMSGDKPVIASSRPAVKPISDQTEDANNCAVQQVGYLPPAAESRPSTDTTMLQPGTVRESIERPGPVIVGQPNIPVQLLSDGQTVPQKPSQILQVSAQQESGPQAPAQAAPSSSGGLTPPARQSGTNPAPNPPSPACCVCEPSNIILVTEPGCPTQKCEIIGVSPHGLGGKALHVKNLETGECFTIVEGGLHRVGNVLSRFCIFRGKTPCPVLCATCDACPPVKAQPAPASEPLPAPQTVKPSAMSVSKPSDPMATSNPSKYAASLLPNDEKVSGPGTDKPVAKTPTELPPATETSGKLPQEPAGVNRLFNKLWSMTSDHEGKGKSDKPKVDSQSKPNRIEEKPARVEAKQDKPKVDEKKSDKSTASAQPEAKPAVPQVKPAEQVPVPVPLVSLATTEPRPIAPPPQPPIKPFNTMNSSAMNQMPQMSPAKPQEEPMAAASTPPAVMGVPMPGGVVTSTVWSRGPVAPASPPPAVASVTRTSSPMEPMSMETTVQLMQVLHTSGVPSQREFAATRLRACDPSVQPYVVEALLTAVRTDTAPLVRMAAIQSLAAMKVKTKPVLSALEAACTDRDPRVRDEAEQALQLLKGDAGLQTADYRGETGK